MRLLYRYFKAFITVLAFLIVSPVLLLFKYLDYCTDDLFSVVVSKMLKLDGDQTDHA